MPAIWGKGFVKAAPNLNSGWNRGNRREVSLALGDGVVCITCLAPYPALTVIIQGRMTPIPLKDVVRNK